MAIKFLLCISLLIFARGGIEFLAVFLGIALSLWVDDYREEKELKNRLEDDFQKIYKEVKLLLLEQIVINT